MNIFHINSSGQIDFTILVKKIKESESEQIIPPSKSLKKQISEKRSLSEQEVDKLVQSLSTRNRILDYTKVVKNTKSMTYVNLNERMYREVAIRSNSVLVELDLNHCFPQILASISKDIEPALFNVEQPFYSEIKNDLADFFSYDIHTQDTVENVIEYFCSLDNPLMSLYLDKVVKLSKSKKPITVVDAFGVEKKLLNAPLLQNIVMPFSSSINTLAYAIAHVIEKKYTYYNRFAFIHKGKMYYYVRTSKLDIFLNSKFFLDGNKLDIKIGVANNVVFG